MQEVDGYTHMVTCIPEFRALIQAIRGQPWLQMPRCQMIMPWESLWPFPKCLLYISIPLPSCGCVIKTCLLLFHIGHKTLVCSLYISAFLSFRALMPWVVNAWLDIAATSVKSTLSIIEIWQHCQQHILCRAFQQLNAHKRPQAEDDKNLPSTYLT